MSLFFQQSPDMAQKTAALELALQQISEAKRQLYRNTTEAKSRIQCNISRQLEALRNREVWLLNQLDVISGAKEEVLQQQSVRLHKTLGVLQSTKGFDSGENNLTRFDLEDMQPEETPHVSFKADSAALREAIMTYGKIDCNTVPGIQSPYVAPDQSAPSLPRNFEDYNDAEHHILYKTVEEINRNKTDKPPCVYVNIPKLSTRIEDWLLPSAPTVSTSDPKYTFPKLSNNLSDWLKSPITICKSGAGSQGGAVPLEGISADASIKTWLHKIKQNPYEEEEDDFEFIEEMSDTRTQTSEDLMEQFSGPRFTIDRDRWLYQQTTTEAKETQFADMMTDDLPMDKWLLRSSSSDVQRDIKTDVSMGHLLTKVSDELDKWLQPCHRQQDAESTDNMEEEEDTWINLKTQVKPQVLSTLCLQHQMGMMGLDNPWLMKRSASPRSMSPASSTCSLTASSTTRSCKFNKWLLDGGQSDTVTTSIPCPTMEKYKKDVANTVWIKPDGPSPPLKNYNPLAFYAAKTSDINVWLKPQSFTFTKSFDAHDKFSFSPLKKVLDLHKSSSNSDWLLKPEVVQSEKPLFEKVLSLEDAKWLHPSSSVSSLPTIEDDLTEEEL